MPLAYWKFHPGKFVKKYFSQSNFFMHISCTSSTCLWHMCEVLKGSIESTKRSWFHNVCTIDHYFNTLYMQRSENGYVQKPVYLPKKIIYSESRSSYFSSVCLLHICKVLKMFNESSKRSWFHKVCSINHSWIFAKVRKWLRQNPVYLSNIYFFCIKLLHAHLQ